MKDHTSVAEGEASVVVKDVEVKSATIKPSGGHSEPAAKSTARSGTPTLMTAYMTPSLSASARSAADCWFAIWCGINLRPQNMRSDDGFKLYIGALCPDYVVSTMSEKRSTRFCQPLR